VNPETRALVNRIWFNCGNLPYNDLVSKRVYDKKMKVIKMFFFHVLNNIDFPMKGTLTRSNSVLVCMRFKIHHYVTEHKIHNCSKTYIVNKLLDICSGCYCEWLAADRHHKDAGGGVLPPLPYDTQV
jgi:hypothetical protein